MSNDRPQIEAAGREHLGTKYAKRLRRSGRLPAVVYGHQKVPVHVSVDHDELIHHLYGGAHLIDLAHDGGKTETCLIKDIQFDYLGTDIIHVDLTRINLSEEVTVSVPIIVKGEDVSPGAKSTGAIVENSMTDLSIKCLATAIPDGIVADISEVELGGTVLVRDLQFPAGVSTDHPENDVVVNIHASRAALSDEDEAAEGEDAASAQPEVIGESDSEEKSDK